MASSKEIRLKSIFKKILINFFDFFGYELKRKNNFSDRWGDFIVEANEHEKKELEFFQKICLASELNLWSINQSLKYICNQKIEGDIVECGVYNGNTLSYIGKISENLNLKKKIWGYDTFGGFVDDTFTNKDIDFKTGKKRQLADSASEESSDGSKSDKNGAQVTEKIKSSTSKEDTHKKADLKSQDSKLNSE